MIKAEMFYIETNYDLEKIENFCSKNNISKDNIVGITAHESELHTNTHGIVDCAVYTLFYEALDWSDDP